MERRQKGEYRILLLLAVLLGACQPKLPNEAESAVLRRFHHEERAWIHSAHKAEQLPGDASSGAVEVWCVNVDHECYNWADMRYGRCVSAYFAVSVGGRWTTRSLQGEPDWEEWYTRGCPQAITGKD
jgi:hypothetical protein